MHICGTRGRWVSWALTSSAPLLLIKNTIIGYTQQIPYEDWNTPQHLHGWTNLDHWLCTKLPSEFSSKRNFILIQIALKLFLKGPIDNKSALVHVIDFWQTLGNHYLDQLEQLKNLPSEDTPIHLMITHSIESYWIPNKKKTKLKLQI